MPINKKARLKVTAGACDQIIIIAKGKTLYKSSMVKPSGNANTAEIVACGVAFVKEWQEKPR
jgi:hypothetical protein